MARASQIAISLALVAILFPARALADGSENTLGACKDGVDNDGDGYLDCADQDCGIFSMCSGKSGKGKSGSTHPGGSGGSATPYHTTKGGFGIFALLMAASAVGQHVEDADGLRGHARAKLDPAGGFGLFGEALIKPTFAIGGEIVLAFPDVDDIKSRSKASDEDWSDWSDWVYCSPCDNGIVFQATFRMRWPISVHPWVRIYPLVSIGIGNYTARYREVTWWWWVVDPDDTNYFGLSYTAGFGVEVSTPVPVTPFLELRYIGGFGGDTDKDNDVEHHMLVLNSFSIVLVGLRFF